jgi:hypothetical protein
MIADRLAAARHELSVKSKTQIDAETWGARAVAALETYQTTRDARWLMASVEFRHEALEHAAGGPPGTLERIQEELRTLMGS